MCIYICTIPINIYTVFTSTPFRDIIYKHMYIHQNYFSIFTVFFNTRKYRLFTVLKYNMYKYTIFKYTTCVYIYTISINICLFPI